MKLNSGLKQKFLRVVAGGAMIALLPVSNAFAVATFPTSGSCAMLITKPVPAGATMPHTAVYNMIAILTITSATAATLTYGQTVVDYTVNGYSVNPAIRRTAADVPVRIEAPAGMPEGTRGLIVSPPDLPVGQTIDATAVAVNGGSTLLIQGNNDAFSGVCQF